MSEGVPLNYINYINVAAFFLSWVLNSSIQQEPGQEEGNFMSGMDELARRYESVMTPASLTFLVAHLILLFEGVFTIGQLLPKYRSNALVQDGVNIWFLVSSVGQFLWSVNFQLESTLGSILSSIFMGIMFFTLSKILLAQAALTKSTQTPEEYWILRFPFSIHCAWVFAVFVMSINAIFVQMESSDFVQCLMGVISLLGFAGVGLKMLYANGSKPNYVIPSILSWFAFGVSLVEQGPKADLNEFGQNIFTGLAIIVGAGLAINVVYVSYKKEYAQKDSLSAAMREEEEEHDTVYVNAPV